MVMAVAFEAKILYLLRKTLQMKKIFYLVLVAVTLFSCVKREYDPEDAQEVTFTAAQIEPAAPLKSTTDYNCIESLTPDYAKIVISGFIEPLYPKVFRLDGKMYTQSIKLSPGTYSVEQFLVMDDMGTPDNTGDDQIYMAIPEEESNFAVYTDPAVAFTFTVDAFTKKEIPVEVLCFQPQFYTLFGFDWFAITEIVIREKCFFGDICVDPDDYLASLYDLDQLPAGCQVDMPAIMKVYLTRNGFRSLTHLSPMAQPLQIMAWARPFASSIRITRILPMYLPLRFTSW